MSKIKDLTLMTRLDKVYGCGALNWDIFFEVPSLEVIRKMSLIDFEVKPGSEVAIGRRKFLRILEELERRGKKVFSCGGGSSANTIFALSHLGFQTGFVGICGNDEYGELLLKELAEAKVDISLVERHGETSLALIILDASRDRFIILSPGSAEASFEKEAFFCAVNDRLKRERILLHLSSLASLEGQAFQKRLLAELSPREGTELFVSFDPGQIYAQKGRTFLLEFAKHSDILFITEGELLEAGLSPEEFFELSVSLLFLKRGKKGAKALTKDAELSTPAVQPERMVDNTGAGDYFNAGVLAWLLRGGSLEKALDFGVRLATLSLSDYGRKGILFMNEQTLLKCD